MEEVTEGGSSVQSERDKIGKRVIFLAGASGGGEKLDWLRHTLHSLRGEGVEVIVLSSILSIPGRRGVISPEIRSFIEEVVRSLERGEETNFTIIGHSLGALEALYALRALKNKIEEIEGVDLDSLNLNVVLVSPIRTEGNKGLGLIPRLREFIANASLAAQHTIYPLPDDYYDNEKEEYDKEVQGRERKKREKRRKMFLEIYGADKIPELPDDVKEEIKENPFLRSFLADFLEQGDIELSKILSKIDEAIKEALRRENHEAVEILVGIRGRLLSPWVQKIDRGEDFRGLYGEGKERELLKEYREAQKGIRKILSILANYAYCLPQVPRVIRDIFIVKEELIEEIRAIFNNAEIIVIGFDRDEIVFPDEYERLREKGVKVVILKDYGHASFSMRPDEFLEVITRYNKAFAKLSDKIIVIEGFEKNG